MIIRKLGVCGALLMSHWLLAGCDLKLARDLADSGMVAALEDCMGTPKGQDLPRDECGMSSLGDGLVCPERQDSEGVPVECKYEHEFTLIGRYPGYGGGGRKVRVSVSTKTRDVHLASHTHRCGTQETGACAESFVAAKATIHQEVEVQIAWNLLGFLRWETVLRQDRSLDVCTWEDHAEPRECGPVENPS